MKRFLVALAGAGVIAALTGFSAFAAEVTLQFGHNAPVTHPLHLSAMAFGDEVKRLTNGDVEVAVHPAATLADLAEGVQGVQLGTIDLYWTDSGGLANTVPALGFSSLPFMFSDFEHAIRAVEKLAPTVEAVMLEEMGIIRLSYSPAGFRMVFTRNKPVSSVADIQGLKFRVPTIPLFVDTFKALGTNATPIPWGDLYSALQTGVVDGMEAPPDAFLSMNFQEVAKYGARTNHIMGDFNLIMNAAKFNSLSANHQTAIRQAAKTHTTDGLRQTMRSAGDEAFAKLEGMMTEMNSSPDADSFRNLVAPVWDSFVAKVPAAKPWIAVVDSAR